MATNAVQEPVEEIRRGSVAVMHCDIQQTTYHPV